MHKNWHSLPFRDISYWTEQKHTDLYGQLPQYYNSQVSNDLLDYNLNEDNLEAQSNQAVQNLTKNLSSFSPERMLELSRSARILQRTINKKLNPLTRPLKSSHSFISEAPVAKTTIEIPLPVKETEQPFCFPKIDNDPSSRKEVELLSYWFGMMLLKILSNDQISDELRF